MNTKKVLRIILLGLLSLMSLHVPFSNLLGANVQFTLFDFMGPTLGVFLGTILGISTALIVQLLNIVFMHAPFSIATFLRLIPTLFAIMYFSKKHTANIIVPIFCIVVFNLHPIGRSAWQYSLLWLIPIAAQFLRKNIFLKSLGATFTAHAVGGVLWIWTFGLSKQIWLALIPQVLVERFLMGVGITASFLILNYLTHSSQVFKKVPELSRK